MGQIAASATVDVSAQLGDDVSLGPGCVVGPGAVIGEGTELRANVVVCAGVEIGKGNRIFANCVIGEEPQMITPDTSAGQCVIGDGNTLRENVTIHRGSQVGTGRTIIGNDCLLMAGAHVGHDCEIADQVVLSNNALLSGHVIVEERAWIGAGNGVHQFSTVGRFAYTGGLSAIQKDLPPYVRAAGCYPLSIKGLNTVGMQRGDIPDASIHVLKEVYMKLYRRSSGEAFAEVLDGLLAEPVTDEHVRYFLESLQRSSQHRLGRYRELFRT